MNYEIILSGKPNCGKSLLFNRLTGLQQKVANFPGVTVDIKMGLTTSGQTVIDFPGIYSLNPLTKDEQIAVEKFREKLAQPNPLLIIAVIDATRLQRSLSIAIQIQRLCADYNKPFIVALNMIDAIKKHGTIDIKALGEELGSPVIPLSARTKEGVSDLIDKTILVAENPDHYVPKIAESSLARSAISIATGLEARYGIKTDYILKNQNKIDLFFLHNLMGPLAFFVIMLLIFQSIFTWASPMMEAIASAVEFVGGTVTERLAPGIFHDFVADAIFGGMGSFLVFIPQIFVLTFMIGLLEDSGYMARATIICHKPLSIFGLTGKSFVPLLSGFACAIPALMAARTIESPKRRILTMLAIPLMACSARLPVYGLLISAFIPPVTFLGGFLGYQGLAFFATYFLGIIVALIISALLAKSSLQKHNDAPFILELPPYRRPHLRPLLLRSVQSASAFITNAGLIIFSVTLVVWVLGYFPNGSGQLQTSYLSYLGKWLEPIFIPMGLDWRFGVAILSSFLAREVFVGTIGTFYGIEGAKDHIETLAQHLQNSHFTLASALALLVFYAIALQCTSTLAVMKKELGSWQVPLAVLVGYGLLAYVLAVSVYQFLSPM